MKIYCTRPGCSDQNAHSTEVANEDLLGMNKHQRDTMKCVTCGMPLILNGRYVPVKKLGQGGFGYTFLALDLKFGLDSKRAIKQFRSDLFLSAGQMARAKKAFEREYKIQDQLRHSQIPRVYEPFDVAVPSDGDINTNRTVYYYFVQEYIEGEDLQKKIKNSPQQSNSTFSEVEVQDILKQILEILSYMHGLSTPIIHRDIKPSNIIQTSAGICHLVDFGAMKQVVKQVSPESESSKTIMGTPDYAPPEQLGAAGAVTFSSDLYTLAKTCICLITGSPSSSSTCGSSKLLAKVLTKMINPDPQMRYQSVLEVQNDLGIGDQWLDTASSAKPDTSDQIMQNNRDSALADARRTTSLVFRQRSRLKWSTLNAFWVLVIFTIILVAIISTNYFQQNKVVYPKPDIPPQKLENSKDILIDYFKPSITSQNLTKLKDISLPDKEATYGGSTTWEPLSNRINSAIEKQREPFKLKLSPINNHVSSEEGIEMLIKEKIDFSLSSKEIMPNIIKGSKTNLLYTTVARTRKVLVVHPDLKIDYITSSEANKIYRGEITKWSELPDRNLPNWTIKYYQTSEKYVFSRRLSKKLYTIRSKESLFKEISEKRGSVTITPINLAMTECSVKTVPIIQDGKDKVKAYSPGDCNKISRKVNTSYINQNDDWKQDLSVFFRDDEKQNIGKAYVMMLCTTEGQNIIEEAGYLPSSKVDISKKDEHRC